MFYVSKQHIQSRLFVEFNWGTLQRWGRVKECVSRLVVSNSLWPHWLKFCPWDFPGKSIGVGRHSNWSGSPVLATPIGVGFQFLFYRIFPIQGSSWPNALPSELPRKPRVRETNMQIVQCLGLAVVGTLTLQGWGEGERLYKRATWHHQPGSPQEGAGVTHTLASLPSSSLLWLPPLNQPQKEPHGAWEPLNSSYRVASWSMEKGSNWVQRSKWKLSNTLFNSMIMCLKYHQFGHNGSYKPSPSGDTPRIFSRPA